MDDKRKKTEEVEDDANEGEGGKSADRRIGATSTSSSRRTTRRSWRATPVGHRARSRELQSGRA